MGENLGRKIIETLPGLKRANGAARHKSKLTMTMRKRMTQLGQDFRRRRCDYGGQDGRADKYRLAAQSGPNVSGCFGSFLHSQYHKHKEPGMPVPHSFQAMDNPQIDSRL
jgi:hypothetical protein